MKFNLVGKRFDRIVVLRETDRKNGLRYWEYQCDCGTIKQADSSTINAGRIKSCGCLMRERIGALNRKASGESAKNRLISIYKKRALKKGFEWELNDKAFFDLTSQSCHYCGTAPTNNTKKISPNSFGHIYFNGIDRIDSNKGYVLENCVPCCHNCNLAKCDFSYEEFLVWLKRITEFRIKNEFKNNCNI